MSHRIPQADWQVPSGHYPAPAFSTPASESQAVQIDIRTSSFPAVEFGLSSQIRRHTATDQATQVQTSWQYIEFSDGGGEQGQGDDSGRATNRRGRGLKRIGETTGDKEEAFPEYKKRPKDYFTHGLVFETLVVHPPRSVISTITRSTEAARRFKESRPRKFIVIRTETRNGISGFSAIPIHTYQGLGVARPGVIKANHAIVYTSKTPPSAEQNELPRRLRSGGAEGPLMRPEIKVDLKHHGEGYSLHRMSRLNYGSPHAFAYKVKVKTIGHVSDLSLPHFELQFRLIWRTNMLQTNPGAQQLQIQANLTARYERANTGHDVLSALQSLRQYAASRHFAAIPEISATRASELAANPLARQSFIRGLRATWASAGDEVDEAEDDEDDAGEDDDEDEDDDDDDDDDDDQDSD